MDARRVITLLALGAIALTACKGDSSGPSGQNVAGTYLYSFVNVNGCSAHLHMPITQSGTNFSGTYAGYIHCGADSAYVTGSVVQGQVHADSVWFYLDSSNWVDVAAIQGTTWNGTFNANLVYYGSPITIAGDFTAVKQ